MSFRFRNRIKVMPGIYLNIGKNGVSTTIGPRGANINIGKNGVYLNTGIPGTGLSNREKLFDGKPNNSNPIPNNKEVVNTNELETEHEIITSHGLIGLKENIENARENRKELNNEIKKTEENYQQLLKELNKKQNSFLSKLFTQKITVENIQNEVEETKAYLEEIKGQFEESRADINIHFDKELENQYKKVIVAFKWLATSKKIWDITTEVVNTETKSSAKTIVNRQEVRFNIENIEFIKSSISALHFENTTGSQIYIYPAFVLTIDNSKNLSLIDINEFNFSFRPQRFLEDKETIPTDAKIIDHTWAKVNKNGTPDLRFVGNYQIPVVQYAEYTLFSNNGINEAYNISNFEFAKSFADELTSYISLLKKTEKRDNNNNIEHGTNEFPPANNHLPMNDMTNLLEDLDPLIEDSARLIVMHQQGSTSLIQRKLKIGFNRAGRIIDQLESIGVVGSFNGANAREVLILDENSLEVFLEKLKKGLIIPLVHSQFSFKYFTLLEDFSKTAQSVVKKIIDNEALTSKLNLSKDGLKDSVNFIVGYELCQILYKLTDKQVIPSSLEATGLLLIYSKLISDPSDDLLTKGYESVVELFENGNLLNPASGALKIGESQSLQVKVSSNDSELIWTDELTKKLPILIALKHQDDSFFDEYSQFLYHFANIIAKADNKISESEEILLKEIYKALQNPLPEKANHNKVISNSDGTLDDAIRELNSLIGLDNVKSEIKTLINFIKIQKAREAKGFKTSPLSYHIVFKGNPGTGKTTVARIVAKIYKALGVLQQGQLVETDRSGLVAEYLGQTAIKVNKTIDSAINGVLFIDEAYSIISDAKDSYGKEAVATLIKRMEDDRDKLIVVIAGYTNEMDDFIETNPGFKSRFNRYIEFTDYTSEELLSIYEGLCSNLDYKLTDDAKTKLNEIFTVAYNNRDNSFGNGRFVRNIFEKSMEGQANRIAGIVELTDEILTTITKDDIPKNL
ncbi:DUF4236 domain-containing protein [Algoriphagus ratkowskyi]|uniref:DUF4236 domain-containing protein n=2 Tax=Algoriphagus ratkowskyi TaxID=57028 RepID=A0ABY3HHF9_9BACT|nr:DUF4236 domain-containing protein [Algoriphagus ratkowskyi]